METTSIKRGSLVCGKSENALTFFNKSMQNIISRLISNSVVEHLPNMSEALGSVPNIAPLQKKNTPFTTRVFYVNMCRLEVCFKERVKCKNFEVINKLIKLLSFLHMFSSLTGLAFVLNSKDLTLQTKGKTKSNLSV